MGDEVTVLLLSGWIDRPGGAKVSTELHDAYN